VSGGGGFGIDEERHEQIARALLCCVVERKVLWRGEKNNNEFSCEGEEHSFIPQKRKTQRDTASEKRERRERDERDERREQR
jgi:hypothetical protein